MQLHKWQQYVNICGWWFEIHIPRYLFVVGWCRTKALVVQECLIQTAARLLSVPCHKSCCFSLRSYAFDQFQGLRNISMFVVCDCKWRTCWQRTCHLMNCGFNPQSWFILDGQCIVAFSRPRLIILSSTILMNWCNKWSGICSTVAADIVDSHRHCQTVQSRYSSILIFFTV